MKNKDVSRETLNRLFGIKTCYADTDSAESAYFRCRPLFLVEDSATIDYVIRHYTFVDHFCGGAVYAEPEAPALFWIPKSALQNTRSML